MMLSKTLGKIPVAKARELVNDGALLIDVRTPVEFAQGHIAGALNMPLGDLGKHAEGLKDKTKPLVVYCRSGARSRAARSILERSGFSQVSDLGAMRRWK
jgi:phage shock protein E